jgi:hypothetical protein
MALLLLGVPAALVAEDYAPYGHENFPMRVYWGDTHVHSSFSMDASSAGNVRLTPADAYRFAKGEAIQAYNGMTARLDTPLDFLVVSDHAEYMGVLPMLRAGDETLLEDPEAKKLAELLEEDPAGGQALGHLIAGLVTNVPLFDHPPAKKSIWSRITKLADEHNDPGNFTSLIGYEWTSMPNGDNLHRVVVYADGADKAGRMIPVSAFDGDRPEDLWNFMDRYESTTHGRILAIPHNANVSNGLMFKVEDSQGRPFDKAYAARRAQHEPIVEVTQIKGDGEAHPLLSPDDEFADFGTWDKSNIRIGNTVPKTPDMLPFEYARSALKLGLGQQAALGVNPFKFGMIGSTDAHTSLATAAEDNFWGKVSMTEPSAERAAGEFFVSEAGPEYNIDSWQQVASGYAAVWATENTRASIFDAMKRREVYATTGSRMTVRFFGGFEYEKQDVDRPDAVRIGYRKGVPMGSDLPMGPKGKPPRFLVLAIKDPNGANLDRIQIVKGWRDRTGELLEKVYDVALSDGRKVGRNGKAEPLKSTVDASTATYTNTVGEPQLSTFWQDPDFDAREHAFYYARVLEIPTPRWTTYDAVRLGADVPEAAPKEIQDRAYTSPIWFTPIR